MKRLLLLLAFAFIASVAHAQGTYTAASCAHSDVNAVINGPTHTAVAGDTIVIPTCTSTTPGGSNTWTTTLKITTPITLKGQGTGNTVLIDAVATGGVGGNKCQGGGPLISMMPSATTGWRITGFTVYSAANDSGACYAHIAVAGGSHSFRIDHLSFTNNCANCTPAVGDDGIVADGYIWGVIDHNTFTGDRFRLLLDHATVWGGTTHGKGDDSWADPDTMGTNQAVYVEDNTITQTEANVGVNPLACEWGARCVLRFNSVSTVGSHGLDTSQPNRSVRHMEVYNNNFTAPAFHQGGANAVDIRGGTGMVFNNHALASAYLPANNGYILNVSYYRCNQSTAGCVTGVHPFGECNGIIDGSNNGLWDQPGQYRCMDGIGTGQGVLINRTGCASSPPACTAAAWPNEAVDPVYEFNNNDDGTLNTAVNPSPAGTNPVQTLNNRDYYQGADCRITSGSQTGGVCVGTFANLPTSCSANPHGGAGVGYWATDQGSWNTSGGNNMQSYAGQGQLYVCTATNTWSLYYTPYTYPHPLTTGSGTTGSGTPSSPTNLQAVVN